MQLAQTLFLILGWAFAARFWKTENVIAALLAFLFFALAIV